MRTVSCPDVAVLLHRKADGRLSGGEPEALRQHLVACDACRRQAEQLDWIRDGLQEHRHEAPSGFSARVQRRLSSRPSSDPAPGAWRWVGLAAALGVVAMLGGRGVQPPRVVESPVVASAVAQPPVPVAVREPEARTAVADEPQPQAAAHRAPRSTLRVQYDLNLRAFPPARGGTPEDPDARPTQSLRERRRLRHQEKIQLGALAAGRRRLPFAK
jgi:anti-sigma factor RsiW